MGHSLANLSAIGQGGAEIVVGLRIVELDAECHFVMANGLVALSATGQGVTDIDWASAKSDLISRAFR